MNTVRKNRLTAALIAALLLPTAAVAQQTDAASEKSEKQVAADEASKTEVQQLTGITVTARKREETLQTVPVAVTAYSAASLDNLDVQDLGDLDAFVPNLTVYAARGSNSTVTAYIRGIGQADPLWGVDPGVGIYLDDVYIARPQGALLDVFDVERIEVLRGPQGSLYGKNTIGGAIKYVSAPLEEDFYGQASITMGSYSQADVKASVNVPFGSSGWVGRFAVASLNRDGFGEVLDTKQPVSDKEILAARATLGYVGNPDFWARISVDWMDDQSGVRGAKMLAPNTNALINVADVPPLDDRYDMRIGMPNINDTSMDGASLTMGWNLNDAWTLKSITAFRESDTETNIDFDTLPQKIADVKAFYSDEQTSQEFQLNYDAGGRFRGVGGLYWFTGEAGGQVLNNFFNLSFGDTQGTVDTDSIAVYGEGTFDINDKWSVTGGIRYTDEEKSADVLNRCYTDATYTTLALACTAANLTPIAADFEDSERFKNFSPKLSLDYRMDENTLLYALVSQGFKSGGFNIRAQATQFPRSRLPFDDEKVTSYEIGAKNAFLDDKLFLNLAYFYNDYKDIQLSVFTSFDSNGDGVNDAFFGDFTNAGAGTVQGIELEYAWQMSEFFSLQGNMAWLDAEYDEFLTESANGTVNNIADQQKFTNAPEYSGSLSAVYARPLASGGRITGRATWTHQSEVYPTTDLSEAIKQDGYSLLSAGVIWQTAGPWSFALEGKNLTDKEYRTSGYNIAALGVLTGFYGAPRTFSLSARYDF
jgi:iron complex outermembrane receptor protein